MKPTNLNFAFFGTPDRAVIALEVLKSSGMKPSLIITQPDRPQGRKFAITPSPAKVWAIKEKIPVFQPETLRDPSCAKALKDGNFDVFVVVAYGEIIPENILSLPKHGCLNIHGSLLPELRGPSPIETAILEDKKNTGVTIMLMDKMVDHGPIISQKPLDIDNWPVKAEELIDIIVREGAKLLVTILPKWLNGEIKAVEQDHTKATFTQKIKKEDGLIKLSDEPRKNLLKIKAFSVWPRTYFFDSENKRVVVTDARLDTDGKLDILSVIPEGKKEMKYGEYKKGHQL